MIMFSEASDRQMLCSILKERGLNGRGVEVGVQEGIFSDIILQYSNLKTLVSVDSWRGWHEKHLETAFNKLKKYRNRSVCVRSNSLVASRLFEDESFDFVYIDADHGYESVRDDINAWWPKLKPRGLFAGHDYTDRPFVDPNRKGRYGVIEAVDQFVLQHGLELKLTNDKPISWYFFKPA